MPFHVSRFDRVLYESNWFVCEALLPAPPPFGRTAEHVRAACVRAGATPEQLAAVFRGNAETVYQLGLAGGASESESA